jgi:hypothetical protein
MKRAKWMMAALALLLCSGRAKADFLYGTASVGGDLNDGPRNGFPVSASASNSGSQGARITFAASGMADVNRVGFGDGFTWQLHTEAHSLM